MSKKVVWITGASSGIGEALVKKYVSEDWNVILSARNEQELLRVKNESQWPEHCTILPLDLIEQKSFPKKVKEAIRFYGKIDLLIHNGGISQRSLVKETNLEVDRKLMEVNFFGTVALTKELLPHFLEKRSGSFAVITSLVGKFGSPFRSSYAASKHALHGFFDSLRAEHFQDNIHVTLICPGFIKTKISINALTADGSPLNEMDNAQAKGMSPENCAKSIYKAISTKKEEVNIGGKERSAVYLKRLFPSVFSKLIRSAKVR